ncbi:CHASE3 domain-containing protein [Flavihumibacter solisilvae]|uniref:Oxygen sensor histidine kinase NreB n=1 Tax=Flavihumibacter solisilvae TaxID=1349421 RepID=A0A0C1L622_9BACT|nr:CHASE3 domain-containing protein [Flavihumibacter solisilvae]KIC95572.1 hypothetical protein OI18_04735 [Flavihumibacter solisilvae]
MIKRIMLQDNIIRHWLGQVVPGITEYGIKKLNHPRLTNERKFLALSIIIIAGILFLGAKTLDNNFLQQEAAHQVDHTRQVMNDAEQISALIKDLELGARGYVITGDHTFLLPFYTIRQTIFYRIANLKAISKDNHEQQARLDTLKNLLQQKLAFLETCIQMRRKGSKVAENYIKENADVNRLAFLENIISAIKAEENRTLATRIEANEKSISAFTTIYLVFFTVLLALSTAFFMTLWKNMRTTMMAKMSLENNRQLLQSIIDNTTSLIYVKDMYGRYTLVNTTFVKTLGLSQEDIIGKTVFEFLDFDRAAANTKLDDQVLGERKLLETEEDMVINGQSHHYYTIKFPLANRNGEVYALVGISTDITDLIIRQELQRQREIVENTIEAQENERKEIGIELHDNISQLLASAKMMLDTALHTTESKDPRLEKARNDIFTAINESRKLSHALVSPFLKNEPITDAIEQLVKDINLAGRMEARMKCSGKKQLNALSEKLKLTLFRICQEQLNNILKYSRASNILIDLKIVSGQVYLEISDDGIGFDPQLKPKGIGLRNIAGRVQFHSGNMQINSSPNNGCTLKIEIPMTAATHPVV